MLKKIEKKENKEKQEESKDNKDDVDVNLAKKSGKRNRPEKINYGYNMNIFKADLREYRKDNYDGKKNQYKDKPKRKNKRRNG